MMWFTGKRLSTDEQLDLVKAVHDNPTAISISTGDTLAVVEYGGISVYRQDFYVRLPESDPRRKSTP